MPTRKVDIKTLDLILEKMVDTVVNSKNEVFDIGETSRQEYQQMERELNETRKKVNEVIDQSDSLEVKARHARNRLSQVSREFKRFTEKEIREAYEQAHSIQMELSVLRNKEEQLKSRRDELERRLNNLKLTVERAEGLVGQISIVLNYLNGDFKQVSEILVDAQEKQAFGLRIIEAQEEERRKLSREIHDGPAQMLANVLMRAELIDRIYKERSPEEAFKEIHDMRKNVRGALYEVRRIIYDLRPMALDDLGLIPTLKRYLSTTEEYHDLEIVYQHLGKEKRLPQRLEVALFRLVQEAVQNGCKHAEAKTITVKTEIKLNQVLVVVKDDGKGFDFTKKKDKSFGIIGMKERVDMLDGSMTIDSEIGNGTVIRIHVPIIES